MFIETAVEPKTYKSSSTPKTPKNLMHNEFGYSQSPHARIELLKLRDELEKCHSKLKRCDKKGKTKKKKKRTRNKKKKTRNKKKRTRNKKRSMGSKKYKGGAQYPGKFGLAQVPPGYERQLQQLKDTDRQVFTVNEKRRDGRTITRSLNVGVGHIKLRIGEEIEICFPNTLLHYFRNMVEMIQLSQTAHWFSFFHKHFGKYYERHPGLSVFGPLKLLDILQTTYEVFPQWNRYRAVTHSKKLLRRVTDLYIEDMKRLGTRAVEYDLQKTTDRIVLLSEAETSGGVSGRDMASSTSAISTLPNTVEGALELLPSKIDTEIQEITLPLTYYMSTVGVGCVADVDFKPITRDTEGEKNLRSALRLTLNFLLEEVIREIDENIRKIKVYLLWYLLTDNNLYKLMVKKVCTFINPQEYWVMWSNKHAKGEDASSLPKYLVADGYEPSNSVYFSYNGRMCHGLNVCGTEIIFQNNKKFYVLPTGEETATVALDISTKLNPRAYESVTEEKVSTLAKIISYKPKMISLHIHASCAYYEYGINKIIWIICIYRLWFAEFQLLFYKKRYIRTKYEDIEGVTQCSIKLAAILSLSISFDELTMISLLLREYDRVTDPTRYVIPKLPMDVLFQLLNIMLKIYEQVKVLAANEYKKSEEYWETWKERMRSRDKAIETNELYSVALEVFRTTKKSTFLNFFEKYENVHKNSDYSRHKIIVDILFTPDDLLMNSLLEQEALSVQLVSEHLFLFSGVRYESPTGTLNLAIVETEGDEPETYDHFEFKGHGELNEYYQDGDDDMNKAVMLQRHLDEYYRDIYNFFKTAINLGITAMSEQVVPALRLPIEECNRNLCEHFAELGY